MDDFLHNLRSGKLKHHDRGRRDYSDYKGPQRRAGADRRKHEHYAKAKKENMNMVKELLETISQNNKRMADAYEARSAVEERKAAALESIAKGLAVYLKSEKPEVEPLVDPVEAPSEEAIAVKEETAPALPEEIIDIKSDRLLDADRKKVFDIISKQKDKKESWEQIARYLVSKSIPTLSGKGKWRGQVVKSFFNKIATG